MIRADRLKRLRLNAGFTQQVVSERTGISRSLIAQYETGARQPTVEKLAKLALLFNVSMDYLYGIHEDALMCNIKCLYELEQNSVLALVAIRSSNII